MPTYANSNLTGAWIVPGAVYIEPEGEIETSVYYWELPTGVTLTDHSPEVIPLTKVLDDNTFPIADTSFSGQYKRLRIHNQTNNLAVISFNEDTTNTLDLVAGEVWEADLNPLYGSIGVVSAGAGYVKAWVFK